MRIAIMLTLVMSALSFGAGQSEKLSPLPKELQRAKVPGFSLVAPDNETWFGRSAMAEEAKKLGVKRVVLSFFATWCVNCREEFVHLRDNAAKLKENGVQVYLINAGESLAEEGKAVASDKDVSDFVEKYAGSLFPYYFDRDFDLLKDFGIVEKNAAKLKLVLPVIVVMDGDLRVLAVFTRAGDDFPQVLWGDL